MNMDQPDDTTEGNSIVEDVPLLISNQDPSQAKKTYTLNPTALVGNDAESGGRESVMQPKGKVHGFRPRDHDNAFITATKSECLREQEMDQRGGIQITGRKPRDHDDADFFGLGK